MDDWTAYAVAGRVLERLIVVFFAGLSVYLGYRLFLQIPEVRDSQGDIKLPMNIAVKVSRVGPGIFFAIFGVAVLLASYFHPITIETPSKSQATGSDAQRGSKFTGGTVNQSQAEQDQILRRRQVAHSIESLNRVKAVLLKKHPGSDPQGYVKTVSDAKLLLMYLTWDPQWGDFATFQRAVDDGRTPEDTSLPQQTRDALKFYGSSERKE